MQFNFLYSKFLISLFLLFKIFINVSVPPGDEGWLCPGCDCKVDCVELLNEAQGTKISVSDGWEVENKNLT